MRKARSELDGVLSALADPTRRAIMARLRAGEGTVSEIASLHDMSLAAVSRHMHVLAAAGLLTRVRSGKSIVCRLNAAPLQGVSAWLDDYEVFWEQKLDALGEFIESQGDHD